MIRRIVTFCLLAASLLLADPRLVRAHPLGVREHHHVNLTLTADSVLIDYRIEIAEPGRSYTMTDEKYKALTTRGAERVARLFALTVNGQTIEPRIVDQSRSADLEVYHFQAPWKLKKGLNTFSFLDLNLIYQAAGFLSIKTEGDMKLPRPIGDEEMGGEVNFTFGWGAAPPAGQDIFIGKDHDRAAPSHAASRPDEGQDHHHGDHAHKGQTASKPILAVSLIAVALVVLILAYTTIFKSGKIFRRK